MIKKKRREPMPDVDLGPDFDPATIADEDDDDSIPTKFDPEVLKITGLTQEDFDNV